MVVVNKDLRLQSKWTLHAGNQPHLEAQQCFKPARSLTASFSSCLLIYAVCVSVVLFKLIDLFTAVSLQLYARPTSSVLLICSVSIRPGKPAAYSPAASCQYCTCSSLSSHRFNRCMYNPYSIFTHQSLLFVILYHLIQNCC